MSCKYYYWYQGDYHCGKCDKDVKDDWYHKYCRDWNYDECPVYKGLMKEAPGPNDGSSGCFLTSACVDARGLADDCRELQTLRAFRDGWLKAQDGGESDVAEYYATAPAIVAAINKLPNAREIFDTIYEELVVPCVAMIDAGDHDGAYRAYKSYTLKLKKAYL